MKQTIPLYEELVSAVKESPPEKIGLRKMCSIINSFREEQKEALYVVMKHHDLINGSNWRCNPYKGKTFEGGKGVLFSFNYIPADLQELILKYIEWIMESE